MHETGCPHGDIVVRSDQESAVMSTVSLDQASPMVWWRAIQSGQGQALLKLEQTLEHQDPACYVFFERLRVGHEGKTSYERLTGIRAKTPGMKSDEGVHRRRSKQKGASGWRDGLYFGTKARRSTCRHHLRLRRVPLVGNSDSGNKPGTARAGIVANTTIPGNHVPSIVGVDQKFFI